MTDKKLEGRIAALEGVCLDLIARLEHIEERLAEYAEDEDVRQMAERAFTDGVSSILNYTVERGDKK